MKNGKLDMVGSLFAKKNWGWLYFFHGKLLKNV